MAWLMIVVVLILVWVVSLCKVLYVSFSPSNVAFLSKGEPDQKRNVILVIAHPDDESMFFSPTILYLTSRGHKLRILCLSTGNADGKGNVRKDELYQAAVTLKVPREQVKIIDHPDIQDGFSNMWSTGLLAKIIKEEIASHDIDLLITFDNYGVSGHPNHRDVHYGTSMFLSEKPELEAWKLVSTTRFRKYIGPVDIWLSILLSNNTPSGSTLCLINEHPAKSFIAMQQHQSQWIWFRKLFVLFSSYTYGNVLTKIKG